MPVVFLSFLYHLFPSKITCSLFLTHWMYSSQVKLRFCLIIRIPHYQYYCHHCSRSCFWHFACDAAFVFPKVLANAKIENVFLLKTYSILRSIATKQLRNQTKRTASWYTHATTIVLRIGCNNAKNDLTCESRFVYSESKSKQSDYLPRKQESNDEKRSPTRQ